MRRGLPRARQRYPLNIPTGDFGAHTKRTPLGTALATRGEIGSRTSYGTLPVVKPYYSLMPELKASLEISTISEDCKVTLARLFSS